MSSSPNNNSDTAANNERARLTEKEKKQNHILSEQKRRQAIRAGFDRLAVLIPGMAGQGRSEAVVLENAVKFDAKNEKRKRKLEKLLVNKALTQAEFDAGYRVEDTVQKDEHGNIIKGEDIAGDD